MMTVSRRCEFKEDNSTAAKLKDPPEKWGTASP